MSLRTRFYRFWFRWVESAPLSRVTLGQRVSFAVPTRVAKGAGSLAIGDDVILGYSQAPRLGNGAILLQPRTQQAAIVVGARTVVSNNAAVVANERITIGEDCLIGELVAVYDSDFHELAPATRRRSPGPSVPVTIGRNVWVGSRSMVLKGVSIGENSVIGAMSVVTRSVPANSVAVGVPARVIRSLE